MSESPNEGTSTVDMIMLFAMPAIIAGLCGAIAYLGMMTAGM